MKIHHIICGLAVVVCTAAGPARAQEPDAEGCKDSPLITRFPGSVIYSCDQKEFDQVEMPVGTDKDGAIVTKALEGEVRTWDYITRENTSELQVFRNFQNALRSAGFTIDYQGSPGELTAHKGNIWLKLDNTGSRYDQTIVTVKAMQQEIAADAASMANAIAATGHVAIYGIHFDTAKATIQPDSEKTLTEIVKLLNDTPDLKLRIEGYTDNVGQPAANQALSERRAQAVVAWLTAHGVAAPRLAAKGLGQANPVADNATEEGRASNRRVELFKM